MTNLIVALALVGSIAGIGDAAAQDWPARPVTMVIPFMAGTGTDALGRIFAERLTEFLGQQVMVENVPGAGSMIGASRVAKATPNGYQFCSVPQLPSLTLKHYTRIHSTTPRQILRRSR